MIRWFVHNPVAANILMIAIVLGGLYATFFRIPLETFPEFERDVINITVAYPGASPYEVEQGIILRIEDVINDLPGIERVYSDAPEGTAQLRIEVRKGNDVTKLLNEVKSRVDGITSFPDDAERPVVEQQVRIRDVITVVVTQETDDEVLLRQTTEDIRDELRGLPGITQIAMGGIRPWEISINISESTLRQFDLTLNDVANAIRNSSRDIPGGTVKTEAGDIRVRALGQAYRKNDFANITVFSTTDGTRIRLGDIATIIDGFNEDPLYSRFDGMPAAFINVSRVGDQNAIRVANTVKDFIETRNATLPQGVELTYWRDSSKYVSARLNTLKQSAIQGIALVLILLALFLRPDLAFWVSLGIPISFLGALMLMPEVGVTLNIVSMFAFIIVLGIVVDDAIVTGENIYTHSKRHNDPVRAAIEGTQEVAVPVTFGVLTTVAAFLPLLLLEGRRAPIFAQIPMIVIPVLLFSLIESKLILPAHLRHIRQRKTADLNWLSRIQQSISHGLERFVDKVYRPFLETTLSWRYVTVSLFVLLLVFVLTMMMSGRYKYTFFPNIPRETVTTTLTMEEGTPVEITSRYAEKITKAAEKLQAKYIEPTTNESIIQHILMTVGSTGSRPRGESTGEAHKASVSFEITPPESRSLTVTSTELKREWRQLVGALPGAQELNIRASMGRGGSALDVQLAGDDFEQMNAVAALIKTKLGEYDGVNEITNSFESGKNEVQLTIRPEAEQLGLTLRDLGTQVRHAVYGAEAQRIQRDQSDVKVMVRYPPEERYSLAALQNLLIRTNTGAQVPLTEVANIALGISTTKISRVDRKRVLNVRADLDKEKADAVKISGDIKAWLPDVLNDYPGITFDLEGEQREQRKFGMSLMIGFGLALVIIYVLLAIPFGSYFQPLMVMSIIPFSVIGAVGGHTLMGLSISISSFMGFLALVGVVVNDSLVLVDYTNKRVKEGVPLMDAVRHSGGARFRPILLTSITTFAGLTPLILEKSTQAQFLIPMAVSLGFGILFATFLTLILIPNFYMILEDIKAGFRKMNN